MTFSSPSWDVEETSIKAHDYADVDKWLQTMDQVGLERSIILSGATGSKFDQILTKYRKYPTRFEVWCGIDYTGFDKPGF